MGGPERAAAAGSGGGPEGGAYGGASGADGGAWAGRSGGLPVSMWSPRGQAIPSVSLPTINPTPDRRWQVVNTRAPPAV
ncbi:hypothetical protein GCM10018980_11350 [Streptomyces capoamus]|uniref:Uncharacterized protein n=1 Tax=Streptomyces capoamus TaxID=68183 RepID=A0A919C0E7_9ACTN|nr:hypothetical protein GCM10010501_34550 [Streptomyces libani subsp. rufus]GHG38520.1 hypothetical protein GCM10018980_11350 [Streptomyces capoamus]